MTSTEILTSYMAAFVDELTSAGIIDAVISPGSRSTPLAILMAEHPEINVHVNIDERSAAFFALGMAKAKKQPVALVCTSGTAAANYYPAIIEACYSRVPLIVITADRPHELRDVGAPQAIDQIQLFGNYAKWFIDLALPEHTDQMIRYVRTVVGRAAATSLSSPAGPVHINVPLREPLVPDLSQENLWLTGKRKNARHTDVYPGKVVCDKAVLEEAAEQLKTYANGLIVCGDYNDSEFSKAVIALAEILNYPILADPLSQLRSGNHSKEYIINAYDTFLKNDQLLAGLKPDVVIRFGAMPVSKSLLLFLKQYEPQEMMVVDGGGGWREPTLSATRMVQCEEKYFCHEIVRMLGSQKVHGDGWLSYWKVINRRATALLHTFANEEKMFEGRVIIELLQVLPDETTLFVGNSMPIRDLDTFFSTSEKRIRILANRGANGIDGVVSSALGAGMTGERTVLLIGDLSFYHDLNGLLAAKMNRIDLTVILVNNDGGGIFSFLPQSKEEKHFERLFGTPVGLEYEKVVHMYGGEFKRVENWAEFQQETAHAFQKSGLQVIEVRTLRQENVKLHRELWKYVSREMNSEQEMAKNV